MFSKKTTIGFFGDSFCADKYAFPWAGYKTYIKLTEEYYNAKIVTLGSGGSSVGDLLINQLNPYIAKKGHPDVCVFVWTQCGRLFNRSIRDLTSSVTESTKTDKITMAAKAYYSHLYDHEFVEIEYKALLEYIDLNILSTFPQTTKIIHLWAFGNYTLWEKNSFTEENINYHYRWKNGVEIRPPLMLLSIKDKELSLLPKDNRPNHLDGTYKNSTVFNAIKDAIDNYENGKLISFID